MRPLLPLTLPGGAPSPPPPRPRRRALWLAGLFALVVIPIAVVKRLDQENRFCVSCHLHTAEYRGMTGDSLATLAAAHARAHRGGHPERCFTCHSGEGVMGWSAVTALSAWDAARWVLGDRHETKAMRLPITNAACLKCHAEVTRGGTSKDPNSVFHALSNHRGVKTPCVTCHVTHARGTHERWFLDPEVVRRQCQTCHNDLWGGGD
jgi:hypothetical protein